MCGENEIRTRDTLYGYTRFPGVPLRRMALYGIDRLIEAKKNKKTCVTLPVL